MTSLQDENEQLRERVRWLEGLLDNAEEIVPIEWGLPRFATRMVARLISAGGQYVPVGVLIQVVYFDRDEPRDAENCIHVYVSRVRAGLRLRGWELVARRGLGYRMTRVPSP